MYGLSLWRLYVRARLRAPELAMSAGLSTHVQLPPFCLTAERWRHHNGKIAMLKIVPDPPHHHSLEVLIQVQVPAEPRTLH